MGISSILSFLALGGFVLFIVGIGMAVLNASQGKGSRGGVLLGAIGLIAGLLFSVVSQGILIVQPNQIAVVFNTITGNLEEPRRAGTQIIVPVVQQYTMYPLEQLQYTMSGNENEGVLRGDAAVRARTTDGQEVNMDVTVIFGLDPTLINQVHQRWQNRYVSDFIRPTARGIVRDVVSQFTAAGIYGQDRGTMEAAIETAMTERMQEEGLTLNDLLVRDINFSEQFTEAIEQAQIAAQEAERARLRVQQIQQEAEQARAQAAGQRDATIARAEGEAQSIVLRAQAEAEALRLVSEQIAANPSLIQYQYIQNLSDNVNLMMVPSTSPFLFGLEDLAAANPNFTAPAVPQAQSLTGSAETEPAPSGGN